MNNEEKSTTKTFYIEELVEFLIKENNVKGLLNIEDNGIDYYIENNIGNYEDLINEWLNNKDLKVKQEIIKNTDYKIFASNMRYIFRLYIGTLSKDNIFEILDNNHFLFSNKIENIKDNYKYIKSKQIISGDELDKIYIGNSITNMQKTIDNTLLNRTKLQERIAQLSIDKKRQEELLENLKLIVKINCIYKSDDLKDISTIKYFDRNLVDNLIEYDNYNYSSKIKFLNKKEYKDIFIFNKSLLEDNLNKININIINDLNNMSDSKELYDFISTLESVKDNDSSIIDKQNNIKDELLTKLSFIVLNKLAHNYMNGNYSDSKLKREFKKRFNSKELLEELNNVSITKDDLKILTNCTIDEYIENNLRDRNNMQDIRTLIKDRLLNELSVSSKFINNEDNNDENKLIINSLDNNLLNQIKPLPNKKEELLKRTNNLIDEISKTNHNKQKRLFKELSEIINCYMYINNEYDMTLLKEKNIVDSITDKKEISEIRYFEEKEKIESIASKINNHSNKTLNINDRIIYNLFYSNRLAHSIDSITINRGLEDNFLMNNNKGYINNYKGSLLKKYNELDDYGISIDYINKSIENYDNNDNSITIYNYIDKIKNHGNDNDKRHLINELIRNRNNDYKKDINEESINKIINNLEMIQKKDNDKTSLNKKIRDKVNPDIKEMITFFKAKDVYRNYLVEEMEKEIGKNIEDFTKSDKAKFFRNNKFVCEVQRVGNKIPLLAVYDKKFNESISVHMTNYYPKKDSEELKNEEVISHHKTYGGIKLSDETNINEIKEQIEIATGFIQLDEGIDKKKAVDSIEYQAKVNNIINLILDSKDDSELSTDETIYAMQEIKKAAEDLSLFNNNNIFVKIKNRIIKDQKEDIPYKKFMGDLAHEKMNSLAINLLKKDDYEVDSNKQLSIFGDEIKIIKDDKEVIISEEEINKDNFEALKEKSGISKK